jgi:hypothetical protein
MFEYRALRGVFRPKREEVTGQSGILRFFII